MPTRLLASAQILQGRGGLDMSTSLSNLDDGLVRRFARPAGASEFQQLLENLPAAAYTCDADGLITYYNSRAIELWGRSPLLNDPIDRYCGSFRLFGAADGVPVAHEACWMALALAEDRGFNDREIIIERPGGERRTVLANANPLHDESGTLSGAVNVLIDITERKDQEIALREADRTKNEFLAMLAHELRNPLAPMRAALDVVRQDGTDPERTQRAHAAMDRQLTQLTRIVDDLLDLSRITRNRLELRPQRVDLGSVLNHAIETCRPLIDASRHELHVALPSAPVSLEADPMRLSQLFSNLLNNAAKYTDPGGHIWLTAERQGSDAVVFLRDTGIGLPPEQLTTIFELFAQGGESVDRSQGGLGIGLTLAKRVVEMHGGSIEAFSDGPGEGSQFVVRLPALVEAAQPESQSGEVAEAPTGGGLRVLVVDDNRDAAESLSMLLEMSGHQTDVAYDGEEAIGAAEQLRPDAILLDIGLPRVDGYEVARRIRASDWGKEAFLVAVTGWGQEEARARSREAGFDEHIVKPVDADQLDRLLAERSALR